jgi:iron complex outermembrane receptor protein
LEITKMPRGSFALLSLLAALLGASSALAQLSDEEDMAMVYGDKSFVTIATGTRMPLSRAPAVASVITAEDIQALGATDLDEVLETVPGLHVARSTQINMPVYVIRGVHRDTNPQVLMLVNGIPVTMAYQGNRGNGTIGVPLENIARIEVIRGPGSALAPVPSTVGMHGCSMAAGWVLWNWPATCVSAAPTARTRR